MSNRRKRKQARKQAARVARETFKAEMAERQGQVMASEDAGRSESHQAYSVNEWDEWEDDTDRDRDRDLSRRAARRQKETQVEV